MLHLQVVKLFHPIVVEVCEFRPFALTPLVPLLMYPTALEPHQDSFQPPPNLDVATRFLRLTAITPFATFAMFHKIFILFF